MVQHPTITAHRSWLRGLAKADYRAAGLAQRDGEGPPGPQKKSNPGRRGGDGADPHAGAKGTAATTERAQVNAG